MKEMSGKERRKYPRIPVRQAVSIKAAKGLRRGEMEDIDLPPINVPPLELEFYPF